MQLVGQALPDRIKIILEIDFVIYKKDYLHASSCIKDML